MHKPPVKRFDGEVRDLCQGSYSPGSGISDLLTSDCALCGWSTIRLHFTLCLLLVLPLTSRDVLIPFGGKPATGRASREMRTYEWGTQSVCPYPPKCLLFRYLHGGVVAFYRTVLRDLKVIHLVKCLSFLLLNQP